LGRDPIREKGGLNLYGFAGNNGINRWDVLGQYYTLDEKDGHVTVTVPIVFDGLTSIDDKENIMSIARLAWGGKFGESVDGKNVTIDFVELSNIPEKSEAYNLIKVQSLGDGRSTTTYSGADKASVVTFNDRDMASSGLIAHELGHVLGNTDHYSVVQRFPDGDRRVPANQYDPRYPIVSGLDLPDINWEANTMGNRDSARINADNIREILRRPTSLRGTVAPGPSLDTSNWWPSSDLYDFSAYHSYPAYYFYVHSGFNLFNGDE